MASNAINFVFDHPIQSVLLLGLFVPAMSSLFKLIYYELRPSSLPRYNHGTSPAWALVTGASDGIGYAYVTELALQGFNVILHGRIEAKVLGLIKELRAKFPGRDFRPLIVDAADRSDWHKLETYSRQLLKEGTNLTVLVNNIGGGRMVVDFAFLSTEASTATDINKLIDINAIFPVQTTKAMLPLLKANQPALVINMGSAAASLGVPYLGPYCASKSFNFTWSTCLRREMIRDGFDIEVFSVQTAKVQSTGSLMAPTSLVVPSSRQFAKSVLKKVGTGEDMIYGHWAQALQVWSMTLVPSMFSDAVAIKVANDEIALERKQT